MGTRSRIAVLALGALSLVVPLAVGTEGTRASAAEPGRAAPDDAPAEGGAPAVDATLTDGGGAPSAALTDEGGHTFSTGELAGNRFSSIGLSWRRTSGAAGPDFTAEARLRRGGVWEEWRSIPLELDEGVAEEASRAGAPAFYAGRTGEADGVEIRFASRPASCRGTCASPSSTRTGTRTCTGTRPPPRCPPRREAGGARHRGPRRLGRRRIQRRPGPEDPEFAPGRARAPHGDRQQQLYPGTGRAPAPAVEEHGAGRHQRHLRPPHQGPRVGGLPLPLRRGPVRRRVGGPQGLGGDAPRRRRSRDPRRPRDRLQHRHLLRRPAGQLRTGQQRRRRGHRPRPPPRRCCAASPISSPGSWASTASTPSAPPGSPPQGAPARTSTGPARNSPSR